jgi:hypothetical protein
MKTSFSCRSVFLVAGTVFAGCWQTSAAAQPAEDAARAGGNVTVRATVSSTDSSAAAGVKDFRYHLMRANTAAGSNAPRSVLSSAPQEPAAFRVWAEDMPAESAAAAGNNATPNVAPANTYYTEDLHNFGGHTLATVAHHAVYLNGAATVWGTPTGFLTDLNSSTLIHVTDQYVGSTANGRYPLSTTVNVTATYYTNTLSQNDILAVVHSAAKAVTGGTGYGHIYHIFLPQGMDTCFDQSNSCYSPDNSSAFVFCAYHSSVTFTDIGHVLYSVEPFQNVSGCSSPASAGTTGATALQNSTDSTLSHEIIEAITDPDPSSGWVVANPSFLSGNEIGDLCEFGKFTHTIGSKVYTTQLMYSNHYHACVDGP